MTDLSKTIAPKSDQLNADDLIGGPRTIKVTKVSACVDSAEQPIAIYFEGDNGKPYKPCKSMRRVLVSMWGRDGNEYPGRAMTIYRDDKVLFGGIAVGGIRISHLSDIERETTMALTTTRAQRKPYMVKPLRRTAPAEDRPAAPAPEEPSDLTRVYTADQIAAAEGFSSTSTQSPAEKAFDPLDWAAGVNRDLEKFESLEELNSFTDDRENKALFAALAKTSPAMAKALSAGITARRKAFEQRAA